MTSQITLADYVKRCVLEDDHIVIILSFLFAWFAEYFCDVSGHVSRRRLCF